MDNMYPYIEYACYIVTGAVVALNAIAPLTKTDKDDKLVNALRWVEDKLSMFVLPFLRSKRK